MPREHKGSVVIGYETIDGIKRPIRKYCSADTELALERKKNTLRKKYAKSGIIDEKTTFKDFAEKWLESKESKSPGTYYNYKRALSHIYPKLGQLKVSEIKPIHAQGILNGLTPSVAKSVANTLRQIFRSAVANDLINKTPMMTVQAPEYKARPKRALTDFERNALKDADLDPRDRLWVMLMLRTGVRRQESAALYWTDIRKGRVYVRRVWDFYVRELRDYPKSFAGFRSMPVPDDLAPLLTGRDGSIDEDLHNADHLKARWKGIWKAWNEAAGGNDIMAVIGKDITPHLLRHTYASDLAKQGYSPKEIQTLLGHGSPIISLDIYAHVEAEKINADRLNSSADSVRIESLKRPI